MTRHRALAPAPAALVAAGALCFAPCLAPAGAQPADRPAPRAAAADAPAAAGDAPLRRGFSVARLARLDTALERAVARGEVAGAVALVLRDGEPVYERAVGWADREAGRRMTPDAVFRIASQTKALTSVAAMTLVEEGRLSLNDPVARFIPTYARTTVAVTADSAVPARRPITVRDLLTHTAGISYGTDSLLAARYAAQGLGPAAGYGWYTADKAEPTCATAERLAALPFAAQPGERYVYGYATDVLGCVVERAAGAPLDRVFAERITGPLGMTSTRFFLPPAERARLAAVYAPPEGGAADADAARAAPARLMRAPAGARGQGDYVDGPRRSFSGGAGLLSTAGDYARFLEMLRRGGAFGAARVLAPSTVAVMTANQTDTLYSRAGEGFGLGFATLERAGARGRPEAAGTFGWGGAYGSSYAVDPREGLVLVLLVQQLPARHSLGERFPMLVYQALVEPRRGAGAR
jgi:CubicO group peptidase (beta-lactamase class C family)